MLEEATVTTDDLTGDENSLSDYISIDLDEDTGTDPYFNDWEEQNQATLKANGYMASAAHASPRKIYLPTNLARHQKLIAIRQREHWMLRHSTARGKSTRLCQEIIPQGIECCGTNS